MRGRIALVAAVLLSACASTGVVSRDPPPDDAAVKVRDAEALVRVGQYLGATRLLDEVARRPPTTPAHDRALLALGRLLVLADNPGLDYRQATRYFDRLLRDHPESPYATDARAWRDLLTAHLALSQELRARSQELEARTQELEARTQELRARSQELETRTQELRVRTQELRARMQDLERLKRLDVELERPKRP